MKSKRPIRDPHLRAIADKAGEAFEASFADLDLALHEGPAPSLAGLLGALVPRPILREALEVADA